jgi:hypothetical protein
MRRMPGTWVCRIAAVVGTLGGLGAALVVGGEIAGKLIDLGMFADTRTWRLALTLFSGIVGASIGGGSALAGSGCRGRDPSPDRRTRRLVAVAWLPILVGAVITPIGDFLAWAGVAAWVTGLALQLAGITRARRQRTA